MLILFILLWAFTAETSASLRISDAITTLLHQSLYEKIFHDKVNKFKGKSYIGHSSYASVKEDSPETVLAVMHNADRLARLGINTHVLVAHDEDRRFLINSLLKLDGAYYHNHINPKHEHQQAGGIYSGYVFVTNVLENGIFKSDESIRFLQSYRHVSFNSLPYEVLCFHRWFLYNSYFERKDMTTERVLVFDNDIIFYKSPQLVQDGVLVKAGNPSNVQLVDMSGETYGTFLSTWTQELLSRMAADLLYIYTSGDDVFNDVISSQSIMIEDLRHFSDMYFLHYFRLIREVVAPNSTAVWDEKARLEDAFYFVQGPTQKLAVIVYWNQFLEALGDNTRPQLDLDRPEDFIALVHFQGSAKSMLQRLISSKYGELLKELKKQ